MKTRHFVVRLILGLMLSGMIVQGGNWPQFRGPGGQGISTEKNLPTAWNANQNIAWKIPVPGEGWSSPIVWENFVFVTTAVGDGSSCHLLCIESDTGKIVWDREVLKQSVAGRKEGRNTFATPTPATDGRLVYTVFFDGTFVAVDFSGKVVWTNRDYPFYSQHGLGSSPILWNGLLIMARDGSSQGENKKLGWQEPWGESFLVALDASTGREKWRAKRGASRIAHVVPVVWTNAQGKAVLLSGAGDVVQAYEPITGEQLWSAVNKGEGVVPSPAVGDGLVFTACGFSGRDSIKAFRVNSTEEGAAGALVWEVRKAMPRVPSLLYVKPHLFSISDPGQVMCIQGDTGDIVWQDRIDGNFGASPVYADGKIYFLSDSGETTVIEAGPDFKVLAKNPLNEKCQASMAVSSGKLFIRTDKHLYCIARE